MATSMGPVEFIAARAHAFLRYDVADMVERLNERFGTDFAEADQLFFD